MKTITVKDLHALDFDTITEYQDYIIDSYINGQLSQVRDLFNAMDKYQQRDFYQWYKLDSDSTQVTDWITENILLAD